MKFLVNLSSRNRIERIQLRKVRKLVSYAYQHSAFYRSLYQTHNFHPSELKTIDDINRIPIVRRRDLRNAPVEQIVTCKNLSKYHLHTTSGSSGLSIRFYFSKWEKILKDYYVLRSYLNAGMNWFAKTVALRDPIDITKPNILQRIGLFFTISS